MKRVSVRPATVWMTIAVTMGLLAVACSSAAPAATTSIPPTTTTIGPPETTSTSLVTTSTTATLPPTTTTTTLPPTTTTTTTMATTTTAPPTTTTTTTSTVPPTTTAATIPPKTHTVSMSEYANAPMAITIAAGDTVRFVNDGDLYHNARSGSDPTPDGLWGSPDIAPDDSWSITFDQPGNYGYFCSLHPTLMPGSVTVDS